MSNRSGNVAISVPRPNGSFLKKCPGVHCGTWHGDEWRFAVRGRRIGVMMRCLPCLIGEASHLEDEHR